MAPAFYVLLNSATNTISPNLTTCLLHSFSSSPSSVNMLGPSLAKPSPGGSPALKLGTTQTLLSGVVTRGGYKWHASPLKKKAQPSTKKCAILSLLTTSLPFTTVSIFLTLPMLPVGLLLPVPSGAFVGSSHRPFPVICPNPPLDWANLPSPQYAPLTLPCMLHVPWRLCAAPIEMPPLAPLSTFLG